METYADSSRNGKEITKTECFKRNFERIWWLVFERKRRVMTLSLVDTINKKKEWEEKFIWEDKKLYFGDADFETTVRDTDRKSKLKPWDSLSKVSY